MKRKIGFYLDAQKLGDWDWQNFLDGNIGMSGTDGQFLLLVIDISKLYNVYFFTNVADKKFDNFITVSVSSLEDTAVQAKELGIDLLIFNNKTNDDIITGIAKLENLKLPFILWDQNGPTANFEQLLAANSYLKRIVCVSQTHANWHRHKRYFPKVTYIYNGKDYPEPTKRDFAKTESVNIGYLGAVGETKGFHWVAMAWPAVKKAFPQATLTVIGSIKTHDRTLKTGDLGIGEPDFEIKYIHPYLGRNLDELQKNGIGFTGHISPNQMPIYMDRLDLGIVNPNMDGSNETFCVSAIDFQACGVPVIGANMGGLKETVNNGQTGILINDSYALADAIIKVFSSRDQLKRYSVNSPAWVRENFSRKTIVMQWQKLIDDVISGKKNKIVSLSLKDLDLKLIAKEIIRLKNRILN